MTASIDFTEFRAHVRRGALDFTVQLPDTWQLHWEEGDDIPGARPVLPPWAATGVLAPCAQLVSADDAMHLVISARLGTGAATLRDAVTPLALAHELVGLALEVRQVGTLIGLTGSSRRGIWGEIPFTALAYVEDGDRVVQLLFRADTPDASAIKTIWNMIVQTFTLDERHGTTVPVESDPNDWWNLALSMEAADRLDDAEALLRERIPHIAFAAQTAELYRQRMLRLLGVGNVDGARAAHAEAANWIRTYASMATSGGEGAALSWERDRFLASLGGAP